MRFVSIAEIKNQLSRLTQARENKEAIIVTHHGKPYALIQAITENDLEDLAWKQLAETRLQQAWEGDDDAFYNHL